MQKGIDRNYSYHLIAVAVMGLFCGLIYSNTFDSEFQFDDLAFVVKNYSIRDIGNIQAISRAVLSQPSRFVGFYSFALNYHFHKLDVRSYHLANLMIHFITVFLLWWFTAMIFSLETQSERIPETE